MASPVNMSGVSKAIRLPTPGPTEHSAEVLREIGYSDADIARIAGKAGGLTMSIALGIVGFGIMGQRLLDAALQHDPAVLRPVAVWDPDPAAKARLDAVAHRRADARQGCGRDRGQSLPLHSLASCQATSITPVRR